MWYARSKIFTLIGIPGTGKSTWASTFFPAKHIVSSDAIRLELHNEVYNGDKNDEVFEEFYRRIEHLADLPARAVVADATNCKASTRLNLREIADNAGAESHLVVFTNVKKAIYRNNLRERPVPDEAMKNFIDKYKQAVLDIFLEPYDSITWIGDTE